MELSFTGTFKNLKKLGYDFMKLYANNYKVYNKKLEESRWNIWVWVAHGGYIELQDLYDNTKQFIEKVKEINWADVEESTTFDTKWKYVYIYYSHNNPKISMRIEKRPMDNQIWKVLYKTVGENWKSKDYDRVKKELFGEIDSCKSITEESAKELIKEINIIQKS